ncbi:TonB-dependent siderophore receptor [Paracoccus zhejiangensis]|uniref:TonB-dependent siderophore receptor n=1 Tax=Paracoccus zhejiangensis TaxID=1077935 RepID=A0A2H5F4M2_9RHOB|nr:TonB-dependent siderophore receptor [Paracoccus zhejiangensis]AUH66494.1 TonB-dependent siderophore receptor [Paracoccus zhejiangensis]
MHLKLHSAVLLGASALAIGTATAQAQEAAQTIVLDGITLTATTDTSVEPEGFLSDYSQAATKTDTPIAEMQQSVSVITTSQIEAQGAENLGQALGYSAGILAEPFGTDPRFDTPYIRGFKADSAQYVNGLRQGRYFGAVGQELYGMQQIEVVRGPSSSLYGAGSPLGVINMVQKRANFTEASEIGLGYDSNGSSQLFFDVNRAANDQTAFRLTGIGRDSSTQIEDLTDKGGYLAGAVRWTPSAATTIDFLASYTKDKPMSPTGVPYALTQVGDGEALRELYTGQKDWDDSDRRLYTIGVEIGHELDNGWKLSQGFRYEKFDWDYQSTYAIAMIDADTISRGSSRQSEESETISVDTRLSGEVVTGQASHRLLFGVDARKYDAYESSQFGTASNLDLSDPDYYAGGQIPFGPPNAGPVLLRQVGVYAQDEVSYGNWRGSLGLRYDWVEQSGERYGSVSEFKDNQVTGRAGLSYVMANGLMPYLSYSTSFDPQAGVNLDGEVLKPTEGEQWEAGIKYQPTAFVGLITASVYDLRQTNLTRGVTEVVDGVTVQGLRQVGEVKSRGFELEATAELSDGWRLRGGYAYNKTEQIAPAGDPISGKEMADAPNHLANLWLDRDFGNGFRAGGGVRYIGTRFIDNANSAELDSVTLVDLSASYQRENMEASLNIANLTDEVYVGACGFSYCSYGEGRTIAAKVTYKW